MKRLLQYSPYDTYRHLRDLHLYIKSEDPRAERILVLDNELAIYRTTIEDVLLRKSPTIKEMLSIRNAIKILNDADVVLSKKVDSVRVIQKKVSPAWIFLLKRPTLKKFEPPALTPLSVQMTKASGNACLFLPNCSNTPRPRNPYRPVRIKSSARCAKAPRERFFSAP